jgi:hypothetical protein
MALWFGVLVVGPGLVHQCPAHPHAQGSMAHGVRHPAHPMPEHGGHQHGCTCPALCCAAPPAWTRSDPPAPALTAMLDLDVRDGFPAPIAPPLPAHLRPFATAPPSLASI